MNHPPLECASRRHMILLQMLASIFVWSAFSGQLEAAYKYPIGISKTWIDPEVERPARPDPWIVDVPGYYYVNYATGSDTGRTYGHPGAPRKTIPNPIPAGSRVEVSGLYNPTAGSLFITYNGDEGAWLANTSGPAWLIGADAENRASFSGSVIHVGKYGCIEFIDNFGSHLGMAINSVTAGKGRIAHHFLLRNSEIKGTNSATDHGGGLSINGNVDAGGAGEDIVVYNNNIHHFGTNVPDGLDYDYICIFVTSNCHRIWVLDNKLHDMNGGGLQVTANSSSTINTTHVYAGRNEIYNTWSNGMASKSAQYLVYSENVIHDVMANIHPYDSSVGIVGQYAANDQWLLFNRIYNCADGIRRVSGNGGERLYAIGNLIYDIAPKKSEGFTDTGYGESGIATWGCNAWIIGNTLYNVPNGILGPFANVSYIENNIISNINESAGEHIYYDLSGPSKDIRINNNLFYQDGGTIRIKLPGVTLMNTNSVNASTYGTGNLTGDPLFRNPASFDLSILSNSPANDAGRAPTALETDVYALFFKTFGVSIERDKSGGVRPPGVPWDIGAYDAGGVVSPPPNPRVDILPR